MVGDYDSGGAGIEGTIDAVELHRSTFFRCITLATQRITVVKIGGEAADAIALEFGEWASARRTDKPNEWSSSQWPSDARDAADRFVSALRANAMVPPVIHFAEWIDLWSMFDTFRRWLTPPDGLEPGNIHTGRFEVYGYALPDGERLARYLADAGVQQWRETDRYIWNLREAVEAWEALVDRSVIVVIREAVDGSVTDEEVTASLKVIPAWISNPSG